jgi:hypothetical protein
MLMRIEHCAARRDVTEAKARRCARCEEPSGRRHNIRLTGKSPAALAKGAVFVNAFFGGPSPALCPECCAVSEMYGALMGYQLHPSVPQARRVAA